MNTRDLVPRAKRSLKAMTGIEWLVVGLIAAVLVAILAGCSTPRNAQVFVTANGDRVEIWCTDSPSHPNQLHTRMLDYPSDTGQPIVNDNDPYCIGGAQGSYITQDPWWNGWVGYHYYTQSSWITRHPSVSITNITNVSTSHSYVPVPGTKATPGKIVGGQSESAATQKAKAATGTLPPPKVTAATAPKTKTTSEPATVPKASGTFAPPAAGSRITAGTPAPPVTTPKATLPPPPPGATPSKTVPKAPAATSPPRTSPPRTSPPRTSPPRTSPSRPKK